MKNLQLRANFGATQRNLRIDPKNLTLQNVVAMQEGEALGHQMWADRRTLEMIVELGNSSPKGIRGRLGHPGVSENTTGRQVQIADQFRVEGNRVLHTSHLLETARKSPAFSQDPIEWILQVAEQNPTELGESVVIETGAVWTLAGGGEIDAYSEEGDRVKRPENALTKYPVMRPVEFYAVDFVNEGALTPDGLFSNAQFYQAGTSKYAEQVFDIVDEWRTKYNVHLTELPSKVNQMMEAYVASRKVKSMNDEELLDNTQNAPEAFQAEEGQGHEEASTTQRAVEMSNQLLTSLTSATQVTEVSSTNRLQALEEQVRDLSTALINQARSLEIMYTQLQRLSGEPVNRDRVPRQPQLSFAPPTELSLSTPVHTSSRRPNGQPATPPPAESSDPRVAAMQAQIARNRRMSRGA